MAGFVANPKPHDDMPIALLAADSSVPAMELD